MKKFMTKGIENAQKKSYMIASVQNLKRLIKEIRRKTNKAVQIKNGNTNRIFYYNMFIRLLFYSLELSINY